MKALAYIALGMIFYDLSIHIVYLFGKQNFFLKRKLNYWPEWNRSDMKRANLRYQQFWSLFWGIAFILLLVYLVKS